MVDYCSFVCFNENYYVNALRTGREGLQGRNRDIGCEGVDEN